MAATTNGANSVTITNEDMVRTGPGTLAGRFRAPSFYWTVFRWDVSEPNRTSSKLVKR